jgi:cell division protein FtsI/penicillin-binding protein 2
MALQLGAISLNQHFNCRESRFFHNGKVYLLPKDHTFLGRLSTVDVLRQSSNRGMAQIGIRLGAKRLYEAARAFGFGERTGYGFDGEAAGFLATPAHWDGLTITRLPMGHAIGATPMQVHRSMGVIASGGVLLNPWIVDRVVAIGGEILQQNKAKVVHRVLTEATARTMRDILYRPDSVTSKAGTTKIAYKTGTSQKLINGLYSHEHHISSCSGFFPAEAPRHVVTVVVDDAQIGGTAYGARVAAPIFHDIVELLLQKNRTK